MRHQTSRTINRKTFSQRFQISCYGCAGEQRSSSHSMIATIE